VPQPSIVWPMPPAKISLATEDVHLWCGSLNRPAPEVAELARTLSNDERDRGDRFRFDSHRQRFLVARGWLRMLLGKYLQIEPQAVELVYSQRGKPALSERFNSSLQFNLSHSEDLVVYAVTGDRSVGIDIEYIRPLPDAAQLAQRFFTARENALLQALPPTQQNIAFFHCWTRKEAYLKACGDGIANGLDRVEVSLTPGEPARLISIGNDLDLANNWYLQDIAPGIGYAGAIAVARQNLNLSCWQIE
jgi:4'-phosphopantetheinyl transferase